VWPRVWPSWLGLARHDRAGQYALGAKVDDDSGHLNREIDAIVAGARCQLNRLEGRAQILGPLLQVTDRFDSIYALVRSSESPEALVSGLAGLLGVSEVVARAVADMQLRSLTPFRQRLIADEYEECSALIADLRLILSSPDRQRELVGTERGDDLAARRPRDPDSGE
jgi:DNA gyrase subunit A